MSAIEAAAHQRSIEHARFILQESFAGSAALRRRDFRESHADRRRMLEQHDPRLAEAIFEAMKANGTWYVPTHLTRWSDAPPSLLRTKYLEVRHDRDARIFTWSASNDAYSLAVPKGVATAKACAVCHEGTRTMPIIESSTRGM